MMLEHLMRGVYDVSNDTESRKNINVTIDIPNFVLYMEENPRVAWLNISID